jgi:hypothetical protein
MQATPLTARPFTARSLTALAVGEAVSGFTPADLFGPSDPGGLYNIQLLSTLFQDSAGTTPAVVDGPVGRVNDISGNDNHLTQTTDTARPTLRQDAGTGRYYLAADGDDFLSTGNIDLTGTDEATWSVAANLNLASANEIVMETGLNSFSTDGTLGIGVTTSNYVAARARGTTYRAVSTATDADNTAFGFVARAKISDPLVQFASTFGANSIALSLGTGNFVNEELNIGARVGGLLPVTGKIYAAMLLGRRIDDDETADLLADFESKAGIS